MLETFYTINPFVRYSAEHWTWILFAIVYSCFWIGLGKKQKNEEQKCKTGLLLALISLGVWIMATALNIFDKKLFAISTILPFHLCYFLNILFVLMHYFKWRIIFDMWFCWVLAACLQGLFTADLDESFPHYINIRYFIVHASLVANVLYAFFVYKYQVGWKHIVYSLLAGNLYYLMMSVLNPLLDTNFMYTVTRPPGTILDLLGNHFYLKANILSIVLFTIVALPFIFISTKRKKHNIVN